MPELGEGLGKVCKDVIAAALQGEQEPLRATLITLDAEYQHALTRSEHTEAGLQVAVTPAIPVSLSVSHTGDRQVTDTANLRVHIEYDRRSEPQIGPAPAPGGG